MRTAKWTMVLKYSARPVDCSPMSRCLAFSEYLRALSKMYMPL